MKEEWKAVECFEGYEVSNFGLVYSHRTGKFLTIRTNHNGYSVVALRLNGKSRTKRVHRLVAEAFISNPDNLPEVDHIVADKTDNSVSNLRWATGSMNTRSRAYSKEAKSKYNGVHPIKDSAKYQCNIFINGKTKHIGTFLKETEAAKAFNQFCIEHSLNRELNIIEEV